MNTSAMHNWQHSMGDIVNALIGAGLAIEWLHEFPFCAWKVVAGCEVVERSGAGQVYYRATVVRAAAAAHVFYSGTGGLMSIAPTVRKLHVTKGDPLKMRVEVATPCGGPYPSHGHLRGGSTWTDEEGRILAILGRATIVVVGLAVGWPGLVGAQRLTPIPHPIGAPDPAVAAAAARSRSAPPTSRWTPLTNQPTLFNGASNPILLTDGTVLVQDTGFPDWWRLTPDDDRQLRERDLE